MNYFKELKVWQKVIELVTETYLKTQLFPKEEICGLTSQIRRCAVSIPSNIAEGYGRNTDKSFSHFLDIARGSLYELETQLIIAKELKFIKDEKLYNEIIMMIDEESKMINAFSRSIKS